MVPTVLALAGLAVAFSFGASARTWASPAPPAPPTFIPTPIGPPPPPPTSAPTSTPIQLASPVVTAPATPVATKAASHSLNFTLDAVRVSRVNNPGNLSGLLAVKPGTTVWLMLYYTIQSLPKNLSRLTVYDIQQNGRSLFKVAFKGTEKKGDVGRFSRYTVYQIPANLAYGKYVYRATLTIGSKVRTRAWNFSIANHDQETSSGH